MGLSLLDRYIAEGRAAKARGDRKGYAEAKAKYHQTKDSTAARKAAYVKSDAKDYDPNSGTEGGQQFLEGIGGGMKNVGLRAARMLTPEADEGNLTRQIEEQSHLDERMSGLQKGGKFVGEMVATAPIGGAAGAGAKAALSLGGRRGLGMLSKTLANAAEGAAGGQAAAEDGAGAGAAMGAAALPALRLLGKAGKTLGMGMNRGKDANTLINHGAELDLGQMNPGGWVDRAIKASENAPLGIGSRIRGRRETALRPVIPALAADMAGMARPRGSMSAREGIDSALSHVEDKFKVVDQVGLDPATAGQVTAGRQGAGRAGWTARGGAFDDRAAQGAKRVEGAELAEASVLRNRAAIRKGSPDPDIRAALRLERGAKGSKLGQAQIDAGKPIGGIDDIHDPTRKAIEGHRGELQKDLLRSSRSKFLPRRERRLIERDLGEQLARLNDKQLTPTKLKSMASSLKQKAREYQQTASPTGESRSLARAYNRAAQFLERKIESALGAGGQDVAAYRTANKQFGALQPLQTAVFKTGATAHGLINPSMLEKALQKVQGKRAWTAGKGGAPRDVAEALKRLEISSFQGGALQSSSLPSTILRAIQGTVGVPLSSRTAAALGRGDHVLGKALRNLSPEKRRLAKSLAALYHGVPGAAASDE